jgi:hypothetical protein
MMASTPGQPAGAGACNSQRRACSDNDTPERTVRIVSPVLKRNRVQRSVRHVEHLASARRARTVSCQHAVCAALTHLVVKAVRELAQEAERGLGHVGAPTLRKAARDPRGAQVQNTTLTRRVSGML